MNMHKIAAKKSSHGCSKDPEISWLHPRLQESSCDACSDQHTQNKGGRSDLRHTVMVCGQYLYFHEEILLFNKPFAFPEIT